MNFLRFYFNAYKGLSKEIWILSAVSLINRAGAMVLPFLSLYLSDNLSFSLKDTGVILSFYGIGSLIGTQTGGWLADKIGYFKTQFWSLFLSTFMYISLLFVDSFWALSLLIMSTSAIADIFRPANMASVSVYSKKENLTRSIGLNRLAINLGYAIGPAVGGLLVVLSGYTILFIVDGLTCLTASLVFFYYLSPKKNAEQQNTEATPVNKSDSPYRDKYFLIFILAILMSAVGFMQLFYTQPIFWKNNFGLSEDHIGLLLALNCVLIVLIEVPLLFKIENKVSSMKMVALGAFLFATSYAVYIFSNWFLIPVISVVLISIGEIFNFPFANTSALKRSKKHNKGKYMAAYAMAFSLSHIIAPGLSFWVVENYSFQVLWMGITGILLLSTLLFYSLRGKMI
jgi:predicted MFS family arabinose efflux permease